MLDEEEKDHLRFLDQTYRDRAKERREAENQALDEDCSNMFLDEESSKAALKKGLDFDLFQREKEKAEVEEKENMNKEKKPEKENVSIFFAIFLIILKRSPRKEQNFNFQKL